MTSDILTVLSGNQLRDDLINHPLFQELKRRSTIAKDQAAVILGQWFHPLHYFPVFLSSLIAVAPKLDGQTHVSKILWQELGEGNPESAHEKIFVKTMINAGFAEEELVRAEAFYSTKTLIDCYRESSLEYLSGLGFLYGTETADLAMVSAIGNAVRKATGLQRLPWVDIHVTQEPEHVVSSTQTLASSFSRDEQKTIIHNAERMWQLWIDFFTVIKERIST